MKILYGTAIFKMTLTLAYDLDLGFFEMCYYFLMRQTHWWSNFSNRSINKDFIGYAVFWPLKVKRFDLGENGCYFRNQRSKSNLYADFERNHYSNLNMNIFRLSDLDLDLWPWPWIFLMCYYFSMRRTHWWPNFLNCSKNEDFVWYGDF